ncbi:hypothetical protein FB451DRAFT_302801 [Mycena latifolia]|nr:hypothetical protein FB451DRAFT_302801 [Mycena latifolia]
MWPWSVGLGVWLFFHLVLRAVLRPQKFALRLHCLCVPEAVGVVLRRRIRCSDFVHLSSNVSNVSRPPFAAASQMSPCAQTKYHPDQHPGSHLITLPAIPIAFVLLKSASLPHLYSPVPVYAFGKTGSTNASTGTNRQPHDLGVNFEIPS